jgi:hypothetical protein
MLEIEWKKESMEQTNLQDDRAAGLAEVVKRV